MKLSQYFSDFTEQISTIMQDDLNQFLAKLIMFVTLLTFVNFIAVAVSAWLVSRTIMAKYKAPSSTNDEPSAPIRFALKLCCVQKYRSGAKVDVDAKEANVYDQIS